MGESQQIILKKVLAVAAQVLATAIPLLILLFNSYSNLYEKIIIIENNQARAKGLVERVIVLETRLNSFESQQEALNDRLVDMILKGVSNSQD